MSTFLVIAIAIIGACVYKMYSDIDINKTSVAGTYPDVSKLSQDVDMLKHSEKNISDVIDEIIPTVVGISKLKDSGNSIFLKDSVNKLGLGSGVIVSENGYILTNQHVAGNKYSTCYVTLENGKSFNGNVVWDDSDLDLAIVKINAKNLKYINLGDSDLLNITDNVYAIR